MISKFPKLFGGMETRRGFFCHPSESWDPGGVGTSRGMRLSWENSLDARSKSGRTKKRVMKDFDNTFGFKK